MTMGILESTIALLFRCKALVVFVKGFHVSPQIGLTIRSTRRRFGFAVKSRAHGGAG